MMCDPTGETLRLHRGYILLGGTGGEQYKQVKYMVGWMGISSAEKNKQERARTPRDWYV